MKDYYKILELPFGATSSEIRSAYHRLAFKYHPDKNFGNPIFEEKFKEINEAYLVLSNENRRIIYQAEYAEYLRGFRPQQNIRQRDPAFTYPRQPRGPATRITNEFKTLKIVVLVLFAALLIFMLYESRGHMTEPPDTKTMLMPSDSLQSIHHLTKDEYYEIVSREMETGDSSWLKYDVDSMVHVLDSMLGTTK